MRSSICRNHAHLPSKTDGGTEEKARESKDVALVVSADRQTDGRPGRLTHSEGVAVADAKLLDCRER